jgi:thiol-disulfide isomerase/thioredoxin
VKKVDMNKLLLPFVTLLIIVGLAVASAFTAQAAAEPVVRAVLFYSPTCPHCHQVINEVLLPMVDEYGEQLQIMGVDTSQAGGAQLYRTAVEHLQIPDDRRGVPTLVAGDTVMVGGSEIPNQFPGLVEKGLATGGIDWPDIPGLTELMAQAERESAPEPTATLQPDVEQTNPTASPQPATGEGVCRPDQENCEEPASGAGVQPAFPEVAGPLPPLNVTVKLTQDGVVRLVFIWAEDCPHCHEVMENVLPPLEEKYGDQLEILAIETSDPTRYEVYLAALELFAVPPQRQGWPAIFVGDTHLLGSVEIPAKLEGLIQKYLGQGGIDYPPITGLDAVGQVRASALTGQEAKPIYLAYFYQTGCQDCDRVKGDLNYLQSKYPQLAVEEFNVRDDATLSEWLGARAGVPEERRLTAPTVFVGDDYLLEEDLDARSLEALLQTYVTGGAEKVWENWDKEEAEQSIIATFKSFDAFTVIGAGLGDGFNPCAFATLVFFVSYLTISGRKGKEVLLVGVAFTLGVFLAYLLVGFGLYRALDLLGDTLTTLGRWLYGFTAVFCLVLAVLSFFDYLKARRGQIGDMALNLPHVLRMRINATIRKTRKARSFVVAAFVTGILVSFLELACTGQVYLPTIVFVMSRPGLKAQATFFLLLYNLLFVAPLVVVFVLAYYGTGAKQLSDFLQRRASTVKLGLSLLFLTLGGWLAYSLI